MTTLGILAVYTALGAFIALLRRYPQWWLSEHLYSSWGPRTDVDCMRRRELLVEGGKFLVLSFVCASAFYLLATGADLLRFGKEFDPGLFLVGTFMFSILTGMGVLAGVYLLIRGLFRSGDYIPSHFCQDCISSGRSLPAAGKKVAGEVQPRTPPE